MKDLAKASLLLAILISTACRTGKPLPLLRARELPARSPEKLLERMMVHEADSFRYYSAKANVSLKLPDGSKSFKSQIRAVNDSAAWVSVVPALGIEVARVLLTADSMKFLDKLHDQYFIGDHLTAKQKFGMQPSLALLQDALMGKAIGLDPNEKYRSDWEDGQYVLTSKEKKRFVRAAEDINPGDTLATDRDMKERKLERTLRKAEEREAIVHRYWIDPDTFRPTRIQITDLAHDRIADIRYEERAGAELDHLPTKLVITLSEPGRTASGTLELSKITLEGPLQLSFNVPEKYQPMP
jgi:hypothetical protein